MIIVWLFLGEGDWDSSGWERVIERSCFEGERERILSFEGINGIVVREFIK